jgi:hypothetical protein
VPIPTPSSTGSTIPDKRRKNSFLQGKHVNQDLFLLFISQGSKIQKTAGKKNILLPVR